jgi:MFS family permease
MSSRGEGGGERASGVDPSRKFYRYIFPVLICLAVVAYLDRMNIGFAKLGMAVSLGLSESIYGLGAAMFFIGYILLDIPANGFLVRFGARRWFAFITLGWGLVTMALAFTPSPTAFYVLRFLLGAFEAGFFPGVVYLGTLWLPFSQRARVNGAVMGAGTFSYVIGGPICGAMLDLGGVGGLQGWQWVFLATGLPAVILGPLMLKLLPDSPETAAFYTDEERAVVRARIAAEHAEDGDVSHNPLRSLVDPRVWMIAFPLTALGVASMGLTYWLPTIVRGFGVSNTVNGFLNVAPWICATAALWWLPKRSEQKNERLWHTVIPALLAAAALAAIPLVASNAIKLALLSVGAAGIYGIIPIFWTLPGRFLRGASAAAGIATVASIGNVGGFMGQTLVPWVNDLTGSALAPVLVVAAALVAAAALSALLLRGPLWRTPASAPAGDNPLHAPAAGAVETI